MMKKWGLWLLVGLIGLVVWALWHNQHRQAPNFALQTLQGQAITQAHFQNKLTLVNFWYPSCPGCVVEMPQLVATQQKFAQTHYQTLAIALPYNTESEVNAYVAQHQLPFVVAIDTTGKVGQAYQVTVAPQSFLVDGQGRIIQSYLGEPDWAQLHGLITAQLAL